MKALRSLLPIVLCVGALAGALWLSLAESGQTTTNPATSNTNSPVAVPVLRPVGLPGEFRALGQKPPTSAQIGALQDIGNRVRNTARAGARPSEHMVRQQVADLEQYLKDFPDSPFNPSIRNTLADFNARRGHFTKALAHWKITGEMTAQFSDGPGKQVADQALAMYSRHLLIAGQTEELADFYQQQSSRLLDGGPLSAMWNRTFEKLRNVLARPQDSYKCGVFALDRLCSHLGLRYDQKRLLWTHSSPAGLSLAQLEQIGAAVGVQMKAVYAGTNGYFPYPSVIHLRDSHYATLLGRVGERWLVHDPGAKQDMVLFTEDLIEEATGYYLVPEGAVTREMSILSEDTAGSVVGRYTSCPPPWEENGECDSGDDLEWNDADPENPAESDCPEPPCPCETGTCEDGMVTWKVSEPYLALWLKDRPLTYRPSKGPLVSPKLLFNQYGETLLHEGSRAVSGNWRLRWVSVARADLSDPASSLSIYSAAVDLPIGARQYYTFPPLGPGVHAVFSTPHHRDGTVLERLSGGGLRLNYRNGRSIIYQYVVDDSDGYSVFYAATQFVNRFGYAITLNYQGGNVPRQITDADGRVTTLNYSTVNGTEYFTGVTTPDSRSFSITYGTFGSANWYLPATITDAVGIASSLNYVQNDQQNAQGAPSTLTTPYGTTSFDHTAGESRFDRFLLVTDPQGGKRAHAIVDVSYDGAWVAYYPDGTPSDIPAMTASQIPDNTPNPDTGYFDPNNPSTGTLEVDDGAYGPISYRPLRNSVVWDQRQVAAIVADPAKTNPNTWAWAEIKRGRIKHWLNYTHATYSLSYLQEPSPDGSTEGQVTWYDYPGKGTVDSRGSQNWPSVTARKLPNGETWWTYTPHNAKGKVLERRSTYTTTGGTVGVRTEAIYRHTTNGSTYDADGMDVLEAKDSAGNYRETFTYNSAHRVLTKRSFHTLTTNPNDSAKYYQTTYGYDASQRMTSLVAPTGLTSTWAYTAGGNAASYTVTQTDSPVARTETRVIVDGRLTSHTDPRGLMRTFLYDGLGRLTRTTWPDTTYTEVSYTRTVGGQPQVILDPVTVRDRLGFITANAYNGLRQKISVTDARNNTTTFTYCTCGSMETITDPLGNKTVNTFDLAGRRTAVEVRKPDQTVVATTSYDYDALGLLESQTDAAGTASFTYNHQGLRVGTWQDNKLFSRTIYDADDRAATVVDRNGVAVTQTFDALGRVKTRTYPGGGVETLNYSARGLTSHVSELNKTTTYNYDEAGRKTSGVTPNSETVSYTYNAAGDLLTLTDGRGKVTTWTYDSGNQGRLWKKKYAGDSFDQIVYGYNANGWLTSRRYHSSAGSYAETLYTYDNNGNLTLVNYPSGTTDISLVYDANNRVTSMTDAVGTTTHTYTAWGALLTEDGPWTTTTDKLTYAYDTARRRTGLTLDQPGGGTFTTTYAFDAAGRMNSVVSPAGTTAYSYLAASYSGNNYASGRITLIDLPGVFQIDQDFTDPLTRLKSTTFKYNGSVSNSHAYVYNAGSQRTKQTLFGGNYVDYTYDNLGQLDTALTKDVGNNPVTGQQFDYGYDAGWNNTTRATGSGTTTWSVNDRNQIANDGGASWSHDANGNRTYQPTGSSSWAYTYNAENQLLSVSEGTTWKLEFVYDGRGRMRVRKDYGWLSGAWYLGTETRYVYDGMELLQQRSSGNVPQVSYTRGLDLSGSVHGAGGIGGLLARSTHAGTTPYTINSSAFYHADGNGNVTYLLKSDASAYASYKYDPYGRTLSSAGTLAGANLLRFSSKPVLLSSTGAWGAYYYGFRFYDPGTQRWLNRDPGEEADGDENLYRFNLNNPLLSADPDGRRPNAMCIFSPAICWGRCHDMAKRTAFERYADPQDPGWDKKVHCYTSCIFNQCTGWIYTGVTFWGGVLHEIRTSDSFVESFWDEAANLYGIGASFYTSCETACNRCPITD
jgi:RHS repeat-associated protein